MMLAWSFAARTVDEVAALLRALSRHRYVRETEFALHFTVLEALAELPAFAPLAAQHEARCEREPDLDLASRDPSLWYPVGVDLAVQALAAFWEPGTVADLVKTRLLASLLQAGLPLAEHAPFASDPEDPPFPELILLDWELLPVVELDPERHRGAVDAMELAGEEIDVSAPVYQEAPSISVVELCQGAHNGVLVDDFLVWSDGPYSYTDYVFRGASKVAKLTDPPVGLRDLDGD